MSFSAFRGSEPAVRQNQKHSHLQGLANGKTEDVCILLVSISAGLLLAGVEFLNLLLEGPQAVPGRIGLQAIGVVDKEGFIGAPGVYDLSQTVFENSSHGHLRPGAERAPGAVGDEPSAGLDGFRIAFEGFFKFGPIGQYPVGKAGVGVALQQIPEGGQGRFGLSLAHLLSGGGIGFEELWPFLVALLNEDREGEGVVDGIPDRRTGQEGFKQDLGGVKISGQKTEK